MKCKWFVIEYKDEVPEEFKQQAHPMLFKFGWGNGYGSCTTNHPSHGMDYYEFQTDVHGRYHFLGRGANIYRDGVLAERV